MERGKAQSFHTRPFFAYFEQFLKDKEMPRGKRKQSANSTDNPARPTSKPVWINVKLDDTDLPAIERYGDNASDIMGEIVELSLQGADIGVKLADDGKSRMAYIIAPDTETGTALCGLSAFADNPYDAIVCLLYKVTVKLDGVLTAPSTADRPRYR